MRLWVQVFVFVLAGVVQAAPRPPSEPDDSDLESGTCPGHPSSEELTAALPTTVPELVVIWPRVGRTLSEPCRSVARMTVVDHHGHLITVSFVLRSSGDPAPDVGFHPWYTPEGEASPDREGPPRNEMTWLPDGAGPNVHAVVAGSPSASEDTLEGAIGFLSAVSPGGVLGP